MNSDAFVSVFARKGKLVIAASGRTRGGARLMVEPVVVLKDDGRPETLAGPLAAAFETSMTTVVPDPDWKSYRSPLPGAAGVKSTKAFFSGTKVCGVRKVPAEARVIVMPVQWLDRHNYRFVETVQEGAEILHGLVTEREIASHVIRLLGLSVADTTL